MRRLPPRSTLTDTRFPSTTLFRSSGGAADVDREHGESSGRGQDLVERNRLVRAVGAGGVARAVVQRGDAALTREQAQRSEEHTSELQSLMRISYAVFCLKKKTKNGRQQQTTNTSVTRWHRTR